MRVAIVSVFVDYLRRGGKKQGVLQPQIGPLVAGLLPRDWTIEIVNDSWRDPDFTKAYDLVFLSCLHPDFDRARQLSHYWRRRGAKTVLGGTMASAYPRLCAPYFDAIVVGDAEGSIPRLVEDVRRGDLQPLYVSGPYDATRVPVPRFDLMADQQALPVSLEASRGCPFRCDFCVLTGLGTRYHPRPVEDVVRDIRAGFAQTRSGTRWWEWHKRVTVVFYDNNLGGDLDWLGALADALQPLGVYWGGPITFNALRDRALVKRLARGGCLSLYTGLETFNPESLATMQKRQNVLSEVRRVVENCFEEGILVDTGLLLNPITDTRDYMRHLPELLAESRIHVPTFVAFESPIPGTPHFKRLAAEPEPALLPNAFLRDFSGYTLVTRPRRESVDSFTEGYREVCGRVNSRGARARRLALDLSGFLRRGQWVSMVPDVIDHWLDVPDFRPDPTRTLVAGTDTAPPEDRRIPFESSDFDSEEHRARICDPWRVTDDTGRVLPEWLDTQPVYRPKGAVAVTLEELVARSAVVA